MPVAMMSHLPCGLDPKVIDRKSMPFQTQYRQSTKIHHGSCEHSLKLDEN